MTENRKKQVPREENTCNCVQLISELVIMKALHRVTKEVEQMFNKRSLTNLLEGFYQVGTKFNLFF